MIKAPEHIYLIEHWQHSVEAIGLCHWLRTQQRVCVRVLSLRGGRVNIAPAATGGR